MPDAIGEEIAAFAGNVHFLDATEEEIAALVQGMLKELAIMISFIAMPAGRKKKLAEVLAYFETYLASRYQQAAQDGESWAPARVASSPIEASQAKI